MIHLAFSNLKTWLAGTFHGVSAEHLQAYANSKFISISTPRLHPLPWRQYSHNSMFDSHPKRRRARILSPRADSRRGAPTRRMGGAVAEPIVASDRPGDGFRSASPILRFGLRASAPRQAARRWEPGPNPSEPQSPYLRAGGSWSVGGGSWSVGEGSWSVGEGSWSVGGRSWSVGRGSWSVGEGSWSVGARSWSVGARSWSVGARSWSVGARSWSIGEGSWSVGEGSWSVGARSWSVGEGSLSRAKTSAGGCGRCRAGLDLPWRARLG